MCTAALALGLPAMAQAWPWFMVSPPVSDQGEPVLLLGGVSEEGVTLKPSSIDAEIDGAPAAPPRSLETFFDFAQTAAEADPTWKSPLAVGLVYLWIKEVPTALSDAELEGVTGFLKRLPARTNAYATLYGRKRQPIPKLKASELGASLHDLTYLGGDRPNLAEAIRIDLKSLLTDESPFKVLLVVTDGRDFTDATGEGPADFAALSGEIAKAGVRLFVLSFPAPDADAEQSARSLADLAAGGTFHRAADQPLELQSTLESLGQAIADMRRVRLEIPWSWRTFGGTHRLRLSLTSDGRRRPIEVGTITLPAATGWLVGLGVALAGVVSLLAVVLFLRGRRPRDEEEPSVLAAAHDLIGRGLSAQRAAAELTRNFPESLADLTTVDPALLSDPRYPLLQTRAGRRRLEEIQALLRRSDDSLLGADLASALAEAIAAKTPARQAALRIAARVPEDQRSNFLRLGLDELASSLRQAGASHPVLALPRSRGTVLAIQDALRGQAGASLAVAWLVRAAGPGQRGETLRVAAGRAVLGRGTNCEIRLDLDKQVAEQHAALSETRGEFAIEPLQGRVKIEDTTAPSRQPLGDGDTIEIGASRLVFKCVTTGNLR
ncbi:MAG: FHA domain-containing protein [Polyangia bacterium]